MNKQDGDSRSWPTPHTTPCFPPPEDPFSPTPPEFDSRINTRTTPAKPYLPRELDIDHQRHNHPKDNAPHGLGGVVLLFILESNFGGG
jgi:hypothetical protein